MSLVKDWKEIIAQEKTLKSEKEDLRKQVLSRLDQEKQILPKITVEVPKSYFDKTGQTHGDFLTSRYPDFDVQKVINEQDNIVFILVKQRNFLSGTITDEDEKIALAKTIVEYSPEIDLDTFQCDYPDLFDRIFEKKISWELNESALEQELLEDPEVFAILRRHSKVKTPSIKILVKEIKDD